MIGLEEYGIFLFVFDEEAMICLFICLFRSWDSLKCYRHGRRKRSEFDFIPGFHSTHIVRRRVKQYSSTFCLPIGHAIAHYTRASKLTRTVMSTL